MIRFAASSIKRLAAATCLLACAAVAMADNVTFTYQGQVKINGQAFDGTGNFKFAILNTSGHTTLWTNDNTASGEPVVSIPLQVTDGVFSVLVGSPDLGMHPINSSLFASRTPLKLRVWFDGNSLGFQQLNPDQTLVDLTLNTISTGIQDYTIYVNGDTGDDDNNGLTPATAKETIQAAVDIVPSQLRCNVTIKIADGVYKESVRVFGISSSGTMYHDTGFDGDYLKLLGDESWTTGTVGSPGVRILGSDNDPPTGPSERLYCASAHNCSAVMFEGISFEYGGSAGAKAENGNFIFKNCKASNNGFAGFFQSQGSFVHLIDCEMTANTNGANITNGILYITGCHSYDNSHSGFQIQGPGVGQVFSALATNNGTNGFSADHNSVLHLVDFTATGNGGYGVHIHTGSIVRGIAGQTLLPNTAGSLSTSPGGHSY